MGLLNPFLTALMIAMFGDDDDKEKYDGIPIYKKCNNLVIYVGNGKYIMYPLSHEFRWIYGLGVIAQSGRWGTSERADTGSVRRPDDLHASR